MRLQCLQVPATSPLQRAQASQACAVDSKAALSRDLGTHLPRHKGQGSVWLHLPSQPTMPLPLHKVHLQEHAG